MRSKQVFGKFQFWYLLDRSVTFHSPILQIGITQEFGKLRKKYLVCWCGKRKHFSRLNLFTCILILLIKMLIMLSSCQLLVPVFGLTVSHSEKLGLEIYIQNCVGTVNVWHLVSECVKSSCYIHVSVEMQPLWLVAFIFTLRCTFDTLVNASTDAVHFVFVVHQWRHCKFSSGLRHLWQ